MRMMPRKTSFMILAALMFCAGSLRAAVVFEQLPNSNDRTSDLKITPLGWAQILAGSFILTENTEVDTVQWWSQEPVDYHQAFSIRFLADDGGRPGEVIGSFGTVITPQELDGAYTRYTVLFAPGQVPVFAAGLTYWISIAGNDPYEGDPDWSKIFYWAMNDERDGYASQSGVDQPWTLVHDMQPAFRLMGTVGVANEPSSFGSIKALFR